MKNNYKILQIKGEDFNKFEELKRKYGFKENVVFFRELIYFYDYNNEK